MLSLKFGNEDSMALTRRIKKLTKSAVQKINGRHTLTCKECNLETVEVSESVVAVTCARCVQKMVAPPAGYVKEKSDKPRGWHFKMFFEHDGIVYSKGEIISDAKEIAKLRKSCKKPVKVKTTTATGKKRGRPKKTDVRNVSTTK